MNGNKQFWDKSYDRTPEGQEEALWACCCGKDDCETGSSK